MSLRTILILTVLMFVLMGCGPNGATGEAGSPPIADNEPSFTFPAVKEADMDNGAHLIVYEDSRLPHILFKIIIPGAGGCFDPEGQTGLAEFTASMLAKGTNAFSRGDFDREMERTASFLTASADMNGLDAVITGSCLTEHFARVFSMAAEMILHPAFPEDEIALLKRDVLNRLITQRSDSRFLGMEAFYKAVYNGHAGARMSPDAKTVKGLKREDLAAFHQANYHPDHMVIGIAGDITMQQAQAAASEMFASWEKAGIPAPEYSQAGPVPPAEITLVHRPHSVQVDHFVGTLGLGWNDPEALDLFFLNQILGSNSSRRLFQNLREEHFYTYGCYSAARFRDYGGVWIARTQGVRYDVAEPALREILNELDRIREEPVPEEEMKIVKRMTNGEYVLKTERPENVLDNAVMRWRYGFPADYWNRYPEKIRAAAAEKVQKFAKRFLAPDRIQIVVVGDGTQIIGWLKNFGSVKVVDTDGKPIVLQQP